MIELDFIDEPIYYHGTKYSSRKINNWSGKIYLFIKMHVTYPSYRENVVWFGNYMV